MAFAIKVPLPSLPTDKLRFVAQKTMYGGKNIDAGDEIFLFTSDTAGGCGLVAQGLVTTAARVAKLPGIARQTPRVDVRIEIIAPARKPLGRREIKPFHDWDDGRPETELNFKFYRQATDKIVGISDETAAFLRTFF